MWGLAQELVDEAAAVSLDDTAAAVRLLAERARVVAEGAGGLSLAAARAGHGGNGKIVCIVSGGNIDSSRLTKILQRRNPGLSVANPVPGPQQARRRGQTRTLRARPARCGPDPRVADQ